MPWAPTLRGHLQKTRPGAHAFLLCFHDHFFAMSSHISSIEMHRVATIAAGAALAAIYNTVIPFTLPPPRSAKQITCLQSISRCRNVLSQTGDVPGFTARSYDYQRTRPLGSAHRWFASAIVRRLRAARGRPIDPGAAAPVARPPTIVAAIGHSTISVRSHRVVLR